MVPDSDADDLTRRAFLRLAGAAGLSVVAAPLLAGRAAAAAPTLGNLTAFRGAMHVHSSFSEGIASLQSQLSEAALNGFDTFWPTDHDWRMSAYQAPQTFHFTKLTESTNGKSYTWKPTTQGSASLSTGGISTTVVSPNDTTTPRGSLRVEVTSSGSSGCSRRYLMSGSAANSCHRTNLAGQTIELGVLPDRVGTNAWAEVLVTLSYRPATAGRPAGTYDLSYRIGSLPAGRSVQGLHGIVNVPLASGTFGTVLLDPCADVAALWPDLVATDNALVDLRLGVTSRNRSPARAYFGYLRFHRTRTDGDLPLQTQADMVSQYAPAYPGLVIGRGVEVSGPVEHANWFGGEQHLLPQGGPAPADLVAYAAAQIHSGGGLASFNHPFGTGSGALLTQAQQDSTRRATAQSLLARQVSGVDIVEAGYRQRGGMSLESHLALFDTLIRSGYWVTGTGVNDDHNGQPGSWSAQANRFYTTAWSASSAEADLLAALRAGEVFVGELGGFGGYLDLSVEGNPMGSVSIQPGSLVRELTITALDPPAGSSVQVVRGPVDESDSLDPGSSVVATLPDTAFSTGQATLGVDTTTSCFVRLNVIDASGRLVAFSNPVGLLQAEPTRPLPAWRRAPDSPTA